MIGGMEVNLTHYTQLVSAKNMKQRANKLISLLWTKKQRKNLCLVENEMNPNAIVVKGSDIKKLLGIFIFIIYRLTDNSPSLSR